MNTTDLFSPAEVGDISVPNRIVMAPMTRARAGASGIHNPLAVEYYRQRATAGLIITESTFISQEGCGSAFSPGICSDAQMTGWKMVVDAVHNEGGRIVLQLWHAGRFSHVSLQRNGEPPVAPSAIPATGQIWIKGGFVAPSKPRALKLSEIKEIIADFRRAALNAMAAGFDGVEIHAANSYLLDQFIRDSTNHRTDRYGGPFENRTRLVVEVAQTVADVFGSRRVGVRLSPITTAMGDTPLDSNPQETYGFLATRLGELDLAYLHCIERETRNLNAANKFDFQALRENFGGCYIANNGYTFDLATNAIESGTADLVSFARPYIANPDLVERFRSRALLEEAPREAFYTGGAHGYIDWKKCADTVPEPRSAEPTKDHSATTASQPLSQAINLYQTP